MYETKIVKYYGKLRLINMIRYNKYLIISFVICMFILYLLTNTIFDIRVNSDNNEIKEMIISSLNKNNISKYKKKKSFDEINEIKENILSENNDYLEWIEINEHGCIYEVNLTPRVKNNEVIKGEPSSIIASKDGLIKHIITYSGVRLKDVNDYVKKGEVLISGNLIKDNELIDTVESRGEVYAEVWYIVDVSIPFDYIEYIDTKRIVNHYYLDIFGKKFTLIGKYDDNNAFSTKKVILDKPYLFFKLYKEEKKIYEYREYNIDEESAYNEALVRSENKIKNKLKNNEYIISKKVLKKEVNSSKMYLEVFFKVYENIGVASSIEKIGETNEFNNQGSN